MITATAFMCVYNEADILAWTLKHLYEQGVGVYIIDNWSTDDSALIAQRFPLVGYEKFPAGGPSKYYSWRPLLHRVEELAQQSQSDWCIHHDCDEIRRSPRKNERLIEAFERVANEGYNAVNHRVYHFMPCDENYRGDPEQHFRYYTEDGIDCRINQVKAWKNHGQRVCISENGGHFAGFPGINIHPERFILKHYPLRSSEHGERKIVQERWNRYDPRERSIGWHVQYGVLVRERAWIHTASTLKEWHDE